MANVDRILLEFSPDRVRSGNDKDLREGLSVASVVGEHLFLASDETAALERLTWDGEAYRNHQTFSLHDFFDLPAKGKDVEEVDIEGISYDQETESLWIAGSHSLRRHKPKGDEKDGVKKLAKVDSQPNRYLLGSIPLDDGAPCRARGKRRAAMLPIKKGGNELTRQLRGDEHLAPSIDVPSKENGFDIEGLTVAGGFVFLGLRGPVLRGWSVLLSMRATPRRSAPEELKLRGLDDEKRRVRKHFLDLGGLGVREVSHIGDDLLILAGPTMDLDGPVALYRWRNAAHETDDELLQKEELEKLADLSYGEGYDHAEGIAVMSGPGEPVQILLVHDSPTRDRLVGDHGLLVDRVTIPHS